MDSELVIDQFWDDLIAMKEATGITRLSKDVLLLRLHKGIVRGKRIGKEWVMSQASAEEYAKGGSGLAEPSFPLERLWDDLISLRDACVITHLKEDALLLRLQRGEVRSKLVGKMWVISRVAAEQYASSHEPRHKPGAVPGSEAAKRGSQAVRERYGPDYYRRLGLQGAESMRQKYGRDYYTRIGLLGGKVTKAKYAGTDHYQQIGKMNKGKRKRNPATSLENTPHQTDAGQT